MSRENSAELATVAGPVIGQVNKDATAKTRKTRIRRTLICIVLVAVVAILTYMVKIAIDAENNAKASKIAAVQKFGDDRGWKHTGLWDINSDNTVIGQVSLGRCVYDVRAQADRPAELQVTLTSSESPQSQAFWTFQIAKLTADDVKARADDYGVTRCFYAKKPKS
ncbi:MAG TPA: hypothetical protein VFO38_03355 [Candidatus Saccharimonadales bacterium]|nr:hypothetical protein [Candidatus Saccharimonadales bacterium]